MNAYIEALLIERRGYEMRKLPHRVAQVDAALAEVGYEVPRKAVAREDKTPAEIEVASVAPDVEKATVKRGRKKVS